MGVFTARELLNDLHYGFRIDIITYSWISVNPIASAFCLNDANGLLGPKTLIIFIGYDEQKLHLLNVVAAQTAVRLLILHHEITV